MTTHGSSTEHTSQAQALNPHLEARSIVRLVQCSQCSLLLRTPVTLPCGHSLCRECLPPTHTRENISYPAIADRQNGITCPFADCRVDHPLSDCSVNVVLLMIMDALKTEIAKARSTAGGGQILLEEMPQFEDPPGDVGEGDVSTDSASLEKAHTRTLSGGRLLATFEFAEKGELHVTSDVKYSSAAENADEHSKADMEVFKAIQTACHEKVECQVCYNMLLDPVTTPCGHTFCRKCLARTLDHGKMCPHCRRELYWAPALNHQASDKMLTAFVSAFYPSEIASRREQVEAEEQSAPDGLNTALFICAVTYPSMPFLLHVFEPRYRLMIRRALDSDRRFGMVAYNQHLHPQGNMGRTQFLETGTMLQIEQHELLDDGRMYLLCRGVYRFKVRAHGMLDGYIVGRVQRHDDVSLTEEERIEAGETAIQEEDEGSPRPNSIGRLPTSELLEQGHAFIRRAHEQSARWLARSILQMYGPPPTDPALFPYWFASVVPIGEDEKYKLLPTSSVRERLKITVRWIHKIESARWFTTNVCNPL